MLRRKCQERLGLLGAALCLGGAALALLSAAAEPAGAANLPPIVVQAERGDSLLAREMRAFMDRALSAYPPAERPRDLSPIFVRIAPNRERFRELARGRSPEWAAGIVLERGRTILVEKSFLRDRVQAQHLLRHELAHVLLDRALGANAVPHWFHEGFAQIHAGEWDSEKLWRLSKAAWTRTAIPLGELRRGFPYAGERARLAYAESQAAVQVLRQDPAAWERLLTLLAGGMPFSSALLRCRGTDLDEFEDWFDNEKMASYRRWSLLFSTTPLFFAMMMIFLAAAWRRRRRRGKEAPGELPEEDWYLRGWIDKRWPR